MGTYKEVAEAFVTGHKGSSMLVVLLFTSIPSLCFFTRSVVMNWLSLAYPKSLPLPPSLSFILDFSLLVVPIILAYTLTEYVNTIILPQLLLILFLILHKPSIICLSGSHSQRVCIEAKRKPFIAQPRSILLLSTCISILAVDFTTFPRYFAKTETFGTSLMDTGVGSFVYMNALSYSIRGGDILSLRNILSSVSPLIIMGTARLVTVSAADYQHHTSEYGVHWNFFYTLAAVSLATTLVCPLLQRVRHGRLILGVCIAILYQLALSYGGLENYVLSHPRTNLVHANKEGLCSSIGMFALFLIATAISDWLLVTPTKDKNNKGVVQWAQWQAKLVRLCVLEIALYSLATILHTHVLASSRSMSNFTYIVWSLAHNTLQIVFALFTQMVISNPNAQSSILSDAVNRNALPFFLACNLLTGAVNLSMHTIYATRATALAILLGYMFVGSSVFSWLEAKQISLKVW